MWLKICGMTSLDAVEAALAARVDAIGCVFSPSVRRVEPAQAAQLAALARLPVLRVDVATGAALPPRLLFDGQRSGSGEAADWVTAARLARSSELILAGGLNAANVSAAIRAVRPFGVDVSSGVESVAGCKSAHKIAGFVEAARAAFQGMAHVAD